jgi:pSer/pThr/pTyr-binding forkhead associated (FHA) protein
MWILRRSDADGAPTFRLVNGTSKTIGRAPAADFLVDAALVSRLHCRITADHEQLNIEDLASTNGTFVNGRRVDTGRLANGDRLTIGRVELTVELVHN